MSSYARMDHAEWAEKNNAALNRVRAKRKAWRPLPEKLDEFQARVMDILGIVFGGIYNAPISWVGVDWHYGGTGVSVVLTGTRCMATWDFSELTRFVFLCHEARIRGQIEPGGFKSFRLSFWRRTTEGRISQRHPNLDEAVADFRSWLPPDHRIARIEAPLTESPR